MVVAEAAARAAARAAAARELEAAAMIARAMAVAAAEARQAVGRLWKPCGRCRRGAGDDDNSNNAYE